MSKSRNSISRKLTVMNMMVSGTALLVACAAFFSYDLFTFRQNLVNDVSIQARIIGTNAVSPLVFNDPQAVENTLSAMRASPHIRYAGIYTPTGRFFGGYWRELSGQKFPLPFVPAYETEVYWFQDGQLALVRPIVFRGKRVGSVYIRSGLGGLTDRLEHYVIILIAILSISLVAALLISRRSQRAISEPMVRLAESARIISRNKNYSVRAAPTGSHDEVDTLIEAFNEMLAEIQQRDVALQEGERQFRMLADSIPQLAWIADTDGNIVWFNQRWYEYTGTTPEQSLGWRWQSVHDPAQLPAVLERWRASLRTGQQFEMVFPLRGADGVFRPFLTLSKPLRDERGVVVRWFGTNTDITEQRRAEEALRRTEKLAATGRLAASIAHEINNPLEAVTNLLYLARRNPVNVEKYLSLADQELDRVAQITRHTLGFYRDTSSPSPVNISEVLQDVLVLYQRKLHEKRIAVNRRYGEGARLLGFPGEIRQIFANLVANAIEAMSEGGCLTIKISRAREWTGRRRRGVRVSVMDEGSGIAPDQMPKLFEPFYTTKKNVGTGLGLWLTQNLVYKHHGFIRVRSHIRPGGTRTVFLVFLPYSAGEDEPSREDGHSHTRLQP